MKKPKIAVVGSLNMDLVHTVNRMPRIGETMNGQQIHYVPGGKGANQAVGCARLGADVTMIGAVGRDGFGHQIVEKMTAFGVNMSQVQSIEDVPTGTATILHLPEDNCIVIVSGANERCTPELIKQNKETIQSADALLVQLEIPLESVELALQLAREAGVPTILNPAPARELPLRILELTDFFTPNETEFESYCKGTLATEQALLEAMQSWQQQFKHKLIVTRGKDGVNCTGDNGLITVAAPKVQVLDTTGAGDCFNAALAFGISSGWDLQRCIEFGISAASLSVTKFGAQDGMPALAEVERFMRH